MVTTINANRKSARELWASWGEEGALLTITGRNLLLMYLILSAIVTSANAGRKLRSWSLGALDLYSQPRNLMI